MNCSACSSPHHGLAHRGRRDIEPAFAQPCYRCSIRTRLTAIAAAAVGLDAELGVDALEVFLDRRRAGAQGCRRCRG